jgi:hypothetical protein
VKRRPPAGSRGGCAMINDATDNDENLDNPDPFRVPWFRIWLTIMLMLGFALLLRTAGCWE